MLLSVPQVALKTGADWVLYQELEDLEAAVREVNPDIPRFDSSCFRLVLRWLLKLAGSDGCCICRGCSCVRETSPLLEFSCCVGDFKHVR